MKTKHIEMVKEYFDEHGQGTIHDIIAYLKGPRIRTGSSPSNRARGLAIPSRLEITNMLSRILKAKKVGRVRGYGYHCSTVIVWSMEGVEA